MKRNEGCLTATQLISTTQENNQEINFWALKSNNYAVSIYIGMKTKTSKQKEEITKEKHILY